MSRMSITWVFMALILLLAGCATSSAPLLIRTPPFGNPSVDEVRTNAAKFTGAAVRWGGKIAKVENRKTDTLIVIVDQELERRGRPYEGSATGGRFMARVEGFLDPAIYTKDKLMTIAGTIEGEATRPVGQFMYRMPVITVNAIKLWEPLPDYDPYYYDPWYPYQPYPYYSPYGRSPGYPHFPRRPYYPWW